MDRRLEKLRLDTFRGKMERDECKINPLADPKKNYMLDESEPLLWDQARDDMILSGL